MATSKEIRDSHKGRMPQADVARMFAARDAEIAKLAQQEIISVADVQALERTGRVIISVEQFAKCSEEARKALLNDEHHFVRDAAAISARQL